MDKTANTFVKNYTESLQFVPENEVKPQREIKQEYIPSERFNRFNTKAILEKKEEAEINTITKFHERFSYSNTTAIYNTIIQDSRGELPVNQVLIHDIGIFYTKYFDTNLYNLYKNSPSFFSEAFFVNEGNKYIVNQANFEAYEKYIYLISMLVYVFQNKESLDGKLDKDYNAVVNWMQIRYSDALPNILEGPHTTYTTPLNFKEHYNALINSASTIFNIVEEAKISKLNLTYNELANFKFAFKNAPNTYNKNYDNARQYNVIVKDSSKLVAKIDEDNNLVFDGSYLDLGDVGNSQILAQYNSIIVKQDMEKTPPTRTLAQQLQLLFNEYSVISVSELSFRYEMFLVDLSKFDFVYLIFPEIITAERTVYNEHGPGTLRIAGTFVKNNDLMRYEFIPNEECVSFIGSQTFVRSFRFYITNNPNGMNAIVPNKFTIIFSKNEIFQHLLGTNLTSDNSSIKFSINPGNIIYKLDDFPLNIKNPYSVIDYVKNLPYIPSIVMRYFLNNYVQDITKYKQNYMAIHSNSRLQSDSLINTSLISYISENVEIENRVKYYTNAIININNNLNKYNSIHIDSISEMIERLTTTNTNDNLTPIIENISTANIVENIERIFNSNIDSEDELNNLLSLSEIINEHIVFNGEVVLTYNPANGTINNLGFIYNKENLILTNNSDENNKYLSDENNKNIILRVFANDMNLIPVNSYLYNPYNSIIRLMPETINNVYDVKNIQYDYNYSIFSLTNTATDMFDFGANVDILNGTFSFNNYQNNIYYATLINEITGKIYFGYNYLSQSYPAININILARAPKYDIYNQNLNVLNVDFFNYVSDENYEYICSFIINGLFKPSFINIAESENINYIINLLIENENNNSSQQFTDDRMTIIISKDTNGAIIINYTGINGDNIIILMTVDYINKHITGFFINTLVNKLKTTTVTITKGTNSPTINSVSMENYINNAIMGGYINNGNYYFINTNNLAYSYVSENNLEYNINNYASYYPNSNIFKTFTVYEKMYTKFFNRLTYITGILINPLPFPYYETIEINDDYIVENKNTNTIIYKFNAPRPYIDSTIVNEQMINKSIQKTFYNTLYINKATPNVLYVDNNTTNDEIFVYKSNNYVITNTNINQVVSGTAIQLSDNVSITFTIDTNNVITSTNINYGNNSIIINGNLIQGNNYIIPYQQRGVILLSIATNISTGNLYTTDITLNIIYSELYSYEWRNNKLYKNYYYHLSSNPGIIINMNSNTNANPLSLYWILNDFNNPIIPIIKYYQNNIDNIVYSDENNNVQFTLNIENKVNNNQRVLLRKNEIPLDELYSTDKIELANSIPIDEIYVAETIDNKVVIDDVDNKDENIDDIVINSNSGIALLSENNNIHISLNFK